MLPPRNRLRNSSEHRSTVRHGVRVSRPLLVLHADGRSPGTGEPVRVGFVVSRAAGGAVVRNAVRRRLRHLMRERLERLPGGTRAVVRARRAAATASSTELARDLDSALDAALAALAENRRSGTGSSTIGATP